MNLNDTALELKRSALELMAQDEPELAERALVYADTLAALYGAVLNIRPSEPLWSDRDRLIMSDRRCRAPYYAALCARGYFGRERLWESYRADLTPAELSALPGVDAVPTAPGEALGLGVDIALKARSDIKIYKCYVLISQEDCLKGALWEAAVRAGENLLEDLTVILCRSAGDILPGADNICAKFSAFGFDTLSVRSDNANAVALALSLPGRSHRPRFICCDV